MIVVPGDARSTAAWMESPEWTVIVLAWTAETAARRRAGASVLAWRRDRVRGMRPSSRDIREHTSDAATAPGPGMASTPDRAYGGDRMSIPVPADRLRAAIEERPPRAYVLTVSDDGRPHAVHGSVRWEGDLLAA